MEPASKSNWFSRVWSRSTSYWGYNVYFVCISISHCYSVLFNVLYGNNCYYNHSKWIWNSSRNFEPFPSFRSNAAFKRSKATIGFVFSTLSNDQSSIDGIFFTMARNRLFQARIPSNPSSILYLDLNNKPIGIKTIFYQYRYLLERVYNYYFDTNTISAFLRGKRIKGIPKLFYPTMG